MSNEKRQKNKIKNKDAYNRIQFCHEISLNMHNIVTSIQPSAIDTNKYKIHQKILRNAKDMYLYSTSYGNTLRKISSKAVIRQPNIIKRLHCRRCNTVLFPPTCTVSYKKYKNNHRDILHTFIKCSFCNYVSKYLTNLDGDPGVVTE